MARVRRKASASTRLNLEIVGIAALGLAVLLGLALWSPAHTGNLGAMTARGLHGAFGAAAWLFPVLIAVFGAIVFLEINVPRLIATTGLAALTYFLLIDTAYDRAGGAVGATLAHGLRALVGPGGARVVLVVLAIVVTVWITNVSVKKVIGWSIAAALVLRGRIRAAAAARLRAQAAKSASPTQASGPKSLREAFHLPESLWRSPTATAAGLPAATAVIAGAGAVAVSTPAPLATVGGLAGPSTTTGGENARNLDAPREEPAAGDDDLDDDESDVYDDADGEEDEDDETEDDDADDDDEYEDEEDEEDDEDDDDLDEADQAQGAAYDVARERRNRSAPARSVIVGEYEPPSLADARRAYRLPDLGLFDPPQAQAADDSTRTHVLEDTLASFGVGAKVSHIVRGPSVTRYELRPERGVKISRISSLADDLALALAATSVRIEAPIPGKSAVGIEIPNAQVSLVAIREILDALPQRGIIPPLNMALGKDLTGRPVFGELGKMPHLLVAGATGSGKSVCLNGIIASLLVSATPDQVQMLFIDPKRVELTVYNGIPHLIKEVITDARLAAGALFEMTKEMDLRYERFAKAGVRKIEEYNAKYPAEKLPYVVIVIDELADLMMVAPAKVETTICRLAQLARATGIHLVVATQRPSVDVITGIIKANIPSRIAFAVSSQVDSRTILDMVGAERLLGRGDMLYLPIDAPKPVRAQGALITGGEVGRLVEFWAAQARPDNLLDVDVTPIGDDDERTRPVDPLCYDAATFIIETNYASTAQLQSQFSIGHPRAVRIMKQLEDFGIVGPHEGTKPRRINIGLGELESIANRLGKDTQTELFTSKL